MAALDISASVRRLGVAAGASVFALNLVYAATLAVGLLSLPSPDAPIADPWFALMEVLIILLAPAMVALAAAVHGRAEAGAKAFGLLGVAFMSQAALLTCGVHAAILAVGRDAAVADPALARVLFAFEWPSVAYALDILAWDVLFPLAALCMAQALHGDRRARPARALLIAAAGLAFAGLAGAFLGDMGLRNIGIIGYVGVFPVAALLLARLFARSRPGRA